MIRFFSSILIVAGLLFLVASSAVAREGDTLEPIDITAEALETWPSTLLNEDDARTIERRIQEARNSGVPFAVRIVDMTQAPSDIPFAVRPFANLDFSQPFSDERQQAIAEAWMKSETVETSEGANDGIVLLVLVPEDRTQTQTIWLIGPNALPINGLTHQNIMATQSVMDQQFASGNMPNGVFLGISEFSYYIQFGEPEQLTRSTLQNALHRAMLPVAMITMLAGVAVPALAFVLSRRNTNTEADPTELSPWEAAALHFGRARSSIPTAMLLEDYHRGSINLLSNGGLRLDPAAESDAIDVLRPFADADGVINQTALYEIDSLTAPVRQDLENALAAKGGFTKYAYTDRTWMLLLMGFTAFLVIIATVPTVISMSAIGVLAILVGVVGVLVGWWWLGYRRYTTPAGKTMLANWLAQASPAERHLFDTAVHQDLLTDPTGGPEVSNQTQMIRTLRGLGSA